MSSAKAPPVFISFRFSEALTEAQRLQQALQNLGIQSFACYAIENGEEWTEVISKALDSCTVFVALATTTYGMRSRDNVLCTHQELRHAMQAKKAFVLAKMCTEYADPFAKVQLGGFQELNWKPGTPVPVELLQAISTKLGSSPHEVMDVWVASVTSSRVGTPNKTIPSELSQQPQGNPHAAGTATWLLRLLGLAHPPNCNQPQLATRELDTLDQLLPRSTKAAGVKTGTSVQPRTPKSFAELVKGLASCRPGTVFDLQRATLNGNILTITTHDITIRNGFITLNGPDDELQVAAPGTVLQLLKVEGRVNLQGYGSGLTARDCGFTSDSIGITVQDKSKLLLVDCQIHGTERGIVVMDGSHAEFHGCSICDNKEIGLQVEGTASLDNCKLNNEGPGIAVFRGGKVSLKECETCSSGDMTCCVQVSAGSLMATKCKMLDSAATGLYVDEGGSVQLEDCDISRNKALGVHVEGNGTSLSARGCKLVDNGEAGLYTVQGGSVKLEDCDISRNEKRGGVYTLGAGTSVTARGCKLLANVGIGLHAGEGSEADLQQCDLSNTVSVHIEGVPRDLGFGSLVHSSAHVTMSSCQLRNNAMCGMLVSDGGKGELHDCNVSGSKSGAGLEVSHAGSLLIARGCTLHDNARPGVVKKDGGRVDLQDCIGTGM